MAKRWIKKAIKRPGALRRATHTKAGKKIAAKKLNAFAKKKGRVGREARLAKTLRKIRRKRI